MARTQELFSIGDVAQLFHLSVSSLRHYETIGLLTPEYTDPATGYRYYGPRQFEVLNTIRYLRALDMPLGQIRAFLRNRDGGLLARDHDDRLRPDERPGKIRDRDPHPRHGGMKKRCPEMVAPDKKTLKKSVKSMFFMVQTRYEVETIKY